MSVSPVPMNDILGWVPLGNMSPPGHLFPTDHQYVYVNDPGNAASVRQVTLSAPGDMTIVLAHRTHYSTTNTDDYAINFALCNEVRGEFGHVTTLSADLLQEFGAFDQNCQSYDLGIGTSATFTSCYTKPIAVKRIAGTVIGATGGQGTSFGLDFTLRDKRNAPLVYANQSRWQSNGADLVYTVAASDYFAEPARTAINARLGNFNGSQLRTIEPRGGAIAYDIAGTLRGVWINPAKATFPDGSHLAIVPDVVDPSRTVISMGTSQPEFASGLYQFTPRDDGFVNRNPAQVSSDGSIYCYEFGQGVLLMQLAGASQLRVEGRTGVTSCETQAPFAFTSKAFDYVR